MSQKPQRPFVPHRTPKRVRPAITASEFRLYTPFVPGSARETNEGMSLTDSGGRVEAQSEVGVSIRPIQDFLDISPVAAAAHRQATNDSPDVGEIEEESDDLPPVEHFLDPLPVVDRFAPDAGRVLMDAEPAGGREFAPTGAVPPDPSQSGWLETDWQHYDWRAAAALGETANDDASNAWATTDWDGRVPRANDPRPTAAHAIATALDEIAQRIRDGELAVPGGGAMADPATIAATLAALLGVKR